MNEIFSKKFTCSSCASTKIIPWLSMEHYEIVKCERCGLGMSQEKNKVSVLEVDYSNYGDHLEKRDDEYFKSRLNISYTKKIFFIILRIFFKPEKANILDFGGGAGFFAKSCSSQGYLNTYLVEPSDKLRGVAERRVKIDKKLIFKNIEEIPAIDFDLIVMLDVIEHLPIDKISSILDYLAKSTKPGGFLLGVTPNRTSFNIDVFKTKDPAIAPPNHTLYFTENSLDKMLKKHGFNKILCFTSGVSTNSFFRKSKFTPSWVEIPNSKQIIFANIIKFIFNVLNIPAAIFGKGYHIYFLYKYNSTSHEINNI